MKSVSLTTALLGLMAAAPTARAGEPAAKTTLTIKGMTCGGCAAGVRIQLKKTEGVTAYEVSFGKGEAEVTYDPAKTAPEKIAASVSKTGFTASVKPGGDKVGDNATGLAEPVSGDSCTKAPGREELLQGRRAGRSHRSGSRCGRPGQPGQGPVASGPGVQCGEGPAPLPGRVVSHLRAQYWDPTRRVGAALRQDIFPDAVDRMQRFEPGQEWTGRAPVPSRWVRQTALFAKGDAASPTSLLWTNDDASAPIEGSLTEQLRRLASGPAPARR